MSKPALPDTRQRSFIRMLLGFFVLLGSFYGVLAILKNPEEKAQKQFVAEKVKPAKTQERQEPRISEPVESNPLPKDRPPSRFPAALQDVKRLLDQGKLEESEALLAQMRAEDPHNVELVYQQALFAAREKSDYETARTLLKEVLLRDPNHIGAADELYAIYEKNEDFEGALAAMEKLETNAGSADHAGIDYGQGRLYLELGHPDEARWRLEQALQSGPDNPLIREQLAAAYMSLGEKDLARREWQTLAQDESAGRASLNAKAKLAEALFIEGRQAEAEIYIREVLQQDPQHRLGNLLSGR
jgi:tetratricopeptide (TPR) repeat protein